MPDASPLVREAGPDDVPAVLAMVGELAEFERALDQVDATEALLAEHLFGTDAVARCHVALDGGAGGDVVGMALWYRTFSTWTGVPGIHLEDLYVRPSARGGGHGTALLAALARVCRDRGYRRLEWQVLDWNTAAIGFYESLGARPQQDWITYRLADEALDRMAGG